MHTMQYTVLCSLLYTTMLYGILYTVLCTTLYTTLN